MLIAEWREKSSRFQKPVKYNKLICIAYLKIHVMVMWYGFGNAKLF